MSDKRLNEQCVLCGEHFWESALDGEVYCPNCGQLTDLYWAFVREEMAKEVAKETVAQDHA